MEEPAQAEEGFVIRARLENGVIVPLKPIPADWCEGSELQITNLDPPHIDIDAWAAEMNALCADSDPEDDRILQEMLDLMRREGKECTRRIFDAMDAAERRRQLPDL
jgi:predicted DNA-binding antitoxin AbrB/MazE fold protein